jgi:hypothetical protein
VAMMEAILYTEATRKMSSMEETEMTSFMVKFKPKLTYLNLTLPYLTSFMVKFLPKLPYLNLTLPYTTSFMLHF